MAAHRATAISAMPIGMPGWPELAFWTASIASARIALAIWVVGSVEVIVDITEVWKLGARAVLAEPIILPDDDSHHLKLHFYSTGYHLMPRFFCPQPLAIGQIVALPEAVAHHVQVLRLAPGDLITLFNGDGGEYTASLSEIARRSASAEIKAHTPREIELPFAVTLAQALPEGSKMDWIIEKAIELGVSGFQPLAAALRGAAVGRARGKKLDHWRGIIVSASEQCGRNRLASLAPPQDYKHWITQQDLHRRIILTPRAEQSLADWARHQAPQAVTLVVGPEGGLSEQEDLALRHGALPLAMGPRILRTETAALAAVSILSAAWGGL
jgi:16S rRNA (uracil1498-N3)-methyltransferase